MGDLAAHANNVGASISDAGISSAQLGGLLDLISDNTISGKIAKDVLDVMIAEGGDPKQIVENKGLKQVTDTGAIEALVEDVINENPDKVEEVKEKPKMVGWFVGQVMKKSGGKANPQAVNQILAKKLGL